MLKMNATGKVAAPSQFSLDARVMEANAKAEVLLAKARDDHQQAAQLWNRAEVRKQRLEKRAKMLVRLATIRAEADHLEAELKKADEEDTANGL